MRVRGGHGEGGTGGSETVELHTGKGDRRREERDKRKEEGVSGAVIPAVVGSGQIYTNTPQHVLSLET